MSPDLACPADNISGLELTRFTAQLGIGTLAARSIDLAVHTAVILFEPGIAFFGRIDDPVPARIRCGHLSNAGEAFRQVHRVQRLLRFR